MNRRIVFYSTALLLLLFSACYYDNKEDLYDIVVIEGPGGASPCEIAAVSYRTDIVPILDLQCNAACHNARDRQGNVILETYGQVQVYVDNSSLIGSVRHIGGFAIMPPSGRKIPDCEIQTIQAWIDIGAPNN